MREMELVYDVCRECEGAGEHLYRYTTYSAEFEQACRECRGVGSVAVAIYTHEPNQPFPKARDQ